MSISSTATWFSMLKGSCGLSRSWLLLGSFATCLGHCPVPFTVVGQSSPLSLLASSLDLLPASFWCSSPSELLDFPLDFQPPPNIILDLLARLWTLAPGWSVVLLDSRATCMSDPPPSAADITQLTSAVRELSLAITAASPSVLEPSTPPGDWELIGEEISDFRLEQDTQVRVAASRVLEDGPGPTPQIDHATRKLSARHPGIDVRARRAFVAGYWARIALDTDTPYRLADPIPPLKYYWWVVLKCPAFEGAALFRDRRDFGRAIENDTDNCVYEAFPSFTEVEIFCCGANRPVPRLAAWRKRHSASSRTVSHPSSSGAHPRSWEGSVPCRPPSPFRSWRGMVGFFLLSLQVSWMRMYFWMLFLQRPRMSLAHQENSVQTSVRRMMMPTLFFWVGRLRSL